MINIAYAATEAPQQPGGVMGILPMLIIFMVFMYFFIIRPQNKRAKAQRELLEGLGKNDEVVTSGGLAGKISELQEDFVILTVAEGVKLTLKKHCVVSVLPKGTLKTI